MFSKKWFFELEKQLIDAGLDSDYQSFAEIKKNLKSPSRVHPDEFASQAIYVILAGGFSQKTAKIIHLKIMNFLRESESVGAGSHLVEGCPTGGVSLYNSLIKIFNNKNKINAVIKIWENHAEITENYYKLGISNDELGIDVLQKKLNYLSKLPHIGKITANHLARNLGENVVKYDIWIQRLGLLYANQSRKLRVESLEQFTSKTDTGSPLVEGCPQGGVSLKIDNKKLSPDIKKHCDEMFSHLESETDLPRGYLDVVLWKACQNKLIKIPHLLD